MKNSPIRNIYIFKFISFNIKEKGLSLYFFTNRTKKITLKNCLFICLEKFYLMIYIFFDFKIYEVEKWVFFLFFKQKIFVGFHDNTRKICKIANFVGFL